MNMKAVRYRRFGPPEVLEYVEVERPVPRANEVLVKVAAAAVNPKDSLTRKGKFRLLSGKHFPRAVGYDVSGTVVECVAGCDRFRPGDKVFGMLNGWAGGTAADFVVIPQGELATAPATIPLEDSAGLPLAAQTSLQALRDLGGLKPGMQVLINGASGGVGTLAVQIAKALGAKVTAVCSARNASLAAEMGADVVLDYQRDDLRTGSARYDIVFDVFGNRPFAQLRHVLSDQGTHVSTVPSLVNVLQHLLSSVRPGPKSRLVVVKSNAADLTQLAAMVDQGKLRPVTDRRFPLAEIIDAHRYVETRRARGKVLLIP